MLLAQSVGKPARRRSAIRGGEARLVPRYSRMLNVRPAERNITARPVHPINRISCFIFLGLLCWLSVSVADLQQLPSS